MKWTIIGYWGAYPEQNEATSGYLLQTSGQNILIDCGSGVLAQLQNVINLEDLDAVILSHYHADHMADVFALQYAAMILHQLGKRKEPLKIYAHDKDESFAKLTYKHYCVAEPIHDQTVLTFGPAKITFQETIHPAYCLAMRIQEDERSITYTADTEWSVPLVQFARQSSLLVSETSLYDEQFGMVPGHLTAGQVGQLAGQAQVKELCLTHLPHYGDHEQLIAEARAHFNGPISLAKSLKSWTL